MNKEQLNQLVTVSDMQTFCDKIVNQLREIVIKKDAKEFYTPKEFSKVTGLPYSTVVYYCNMHMIEATQSHPGGPWIISRSEVEKRQQQAKDNVIE